MQTAKANTTTRQANKQQTPTHFSLNKTKENNSAIEYCLLPNLISLNIMYSQHF